VKHYIIPMFIPHYGCPHQCVFCDQRAITGVRRPATASDVERNIQQHLAAINRPYHIEVAFYGGSFTALPPNLQIDLLNPAKAALDKGLIHAIRVSTRPDAISEESVNRLKKYDVSTVELGVQSMDDSVLDAAKRGHSVQDVVNARKMLKQFGIPCGIQLMPGLPKEDWLSLIRTGRQIERLKPEFVRIYPTVVMPFTPLAELFQQGQYKPLTIAQGVSRAAYLKLLFEQQGIPVIRTGLQATEGLSAPGNVLAGAYHPAFGEMVDAYIFYLMICRIIESKPPAYASTLIISHHPKDSSKIRGVSNTNLNSWRRQYKLTQCRFIPDWHRLGELCVTYGECSCIINKSMINT